MEYKSGGVAIPTNGSGGDGWEISGYASWFNNLDQGGDIVRPGAYARTLQERPSVPLLWQHQTDEPIGKTYLMHEDSNGLFFKARLDPTRRGNDARILTKAGTLSGVSIGYDSISPERKPDYRELNEIELWEISLVTFGMNPKAQLSRAGKMRDILLIAEMEAYQAKNWPIPQYKMLKCIEAMQREMERLQYDGLTERELLYQICLELQELKALDI